MARAKMATDAHIINATPLINHALELLVDVEDLFPCLRVFDGRGRDSFALLQVSE